MPALQTSYSERMPIGYPGMPATMVGYDAASLICESATIPFGRVVSQGSAHNGALLGATAAALFRGISVRNIAINPSNEGDQYVQYDNMSAMIRGEMWVEVEYVVVAGEPVTYDTVTGMLSTLATSGTQLLLAGARWKTTQTTVGGLAIVYLDGSLPTQNMSS